MLLKEGSFALKGLWLIIAVADATTDDALTLEATCTQLS